MPCGDVLKQQRLYERHRWRRCGRLGGCCGVVRPHWQHELICPDLVRRRRGVSIVSAVLEVANACRLRVTFDHVAVTKVNWPEVDLTAGGATEPVLLIFVVGEGDSAHDRRSPEATGAARDGDVPLQPHSAVGQGIRHRSLLPVGAAHSLAAAHRACGRLVGHYKSARRARYDGAASQSGSD